MSEKLSKTVQPKAEKIRFLAAPTKIVPTITGHLLVPFISPAVVDRKAAKIQALNLDQARGRQRVGVISYARFYRLWGGGEGGIEVITCPHILD